VDAYRWLLDRYVRAHIGRESLAKLSAVHVQTMMTALERRGLSPASRRKVRAVLRKAYADAIRLGVASFNPVDAVDAPKVSAPLISDALTQVEADQLRKAMAGTRYEPLFLLCLGTGLRKGEASALRWCDVDLESATVTVAGTLKRTTNGELIVDSPKTSAGKREVPLPKRCVEALRSWKAIQAEERIKAGKTWGHRPEEVAQGRVETKEREEDFVFTTPHGMPVNPRNVTRAYHAVTQKAGLGKRRLHALRHTAATSWIESDVDLSVVSRYLGHANFSITADTYVAVRPETLRKAADAMDRWLS
jgi:integrase